MKRLASVALFLLVMPKLFIADDDTFGSLVGSHYENRMYGFSVDIPPSWQVAGKQTQEHATASAAANDILFLVLERDSRSGDPGAIIVVKGEKFSGTPSVSAEKVKSYSQDFAQRTTAQILKGPFLINVGGIDMFRGDLLLTGSGQNQYLALLAVGIRDRILVFQISSSSREHMEEAAGLLVSAVKFLPEFSLPGGELDTSKPVVNPSAGVMDGLVLKRVPPLLPEEARKAHARGSVTLYAEISRQGKVQRLWIVDFDEALRVPSSEAAMWNGWLGYAAGEAVRQWTYRPYVVDGRPVRVNVHIVVSYQ
jgi:hypothetical protein